MIYLIEAPGQTLRKTEHVQPSYLFSMPLTKL